MMEDTRGHMDIRQHRQTWRMFAGLVKWNIILIAIIMILLAIFVA